MRKKKIKAAYLGSGAFSTALVYLFPFIRNWMWEYKEEHAVEMKRTRMCRHLDNVKIPSATVISSDIAKVIKEATLIFIVVPSDKVEETIEKAKPFITRNQKIIICSKGFGSGQRLLVDCVQELLPNNSVLYLTGPMIAGEIVAGKFCGAVLAGNGARVVKKILQSKKFSIRISNDIVGLQLGAALKNLFTMFRGTVIGADMGFNSHSWLFNEAMCEIQNIGAKFGADKETFAGLAYLCDLLLPSRNYEFGVRLGQEEKKEDIMVEMRLVPEGLGTLKNALVLARKHRLDVPIIFCLDKIVSRVQKPVLAIEELLELLNVRTQ